MFLLEITPSNRPLIRFCTIVFRVLGWLLVIFSIIWASQMINVMRNQIPLSDKFNFIYKHFLGIGTDRYRIAGMDIIFIGFISLGISDLLCLLLEPHEKPGLICRVFKPVVFLYMFALILKAFLIWANYLGFVISESRDYAQWWQVVNFLVPSVSFLALEILSFYILLRVYNIIRASKSSVTVHSEQQ